MFDANSFKTICKANSFHILESQLNSISQYLRYLTEWNKRINLISRRDQHEIWKKHILESTSFLFTYELQSKSTILDLGTGGGLPGIPIAILQPSVDITLLDSIRKKTVAVQDILSQLELNNARIICSRAEDLGRKKEFQYSFDYIITRAVAPINDIVYWSKPLLKKVSRNVPQSQDSNSHMSISSGSIIMLKGGDLTKEISSANQRHPEIKTFIYPIAIKGLEAGELSDKKLVIAHL
jgi:16S rRNA (guanine527-N7)-methyltransferase